MSDNTIGFRDITGELTPKINAVAEAEGLSRAAVVRRAVIRDMAGMFGPNVLTPLGRQEDAAA